MIKKYKQQISNSFIYLFSTIISKAIPFLLLPIFTTYLSKKDYGVLGLITSILAITNIYIGLKPSLFLIVKLPQLLKNQIAIYIYNIFFIILYTFVISMMLLFFVQFFFFSDISLYIFILLAFISAFNTLNEILTTLFQMEKKAFFYAAYQLFKTFFSLGGALILIIIFNLGWKGKFFADFTIMFLLSFFVIYYLKKHNYIQKIFDISKQIELIKYLFPLSFHMLGLVLMSSIDRLFLVNMKGLEIAGLYTVAYTIGAVLGVIHDALLKVWAPEFYSRIKGATSETLIKILRFQYLYIIGAFVIYGIFILVMPYIFKLMVNEKFYQAYNVIPVIGLGLTFEAIRKLFISYHYNLGKNMRIAFITLLAGFFNVIFNYMLIPRFGIMGAAYATLISYFIVAVITIFDVNRLMNIPWLLK